MSESLKDEIIIYFGPDRWAGLWRNRHQLMSRFARQNIVWYVEPPTSLRQVVTSGSRSADAPSNLRNRLLTRDASGVNVFHSPWWMPVAGRPPLRRVSIRWYLGVLSVAARLGERRPIVWLSRPNMVSYLGGLHAKLTIYHVVDEYSGYRFTAPEQQELLVRREAELLRRVDLVFVVTPTLLRSKLPYNPNTYHIPNAVDFAAYDGCGSGAPADLTPIPNPIIGYSGLIAPRLDLELVLSAAESRPEWSYVFVGYVREEECRPQIARLRALPNVHFLGCKSVEQVPAYVRHFDVGMIPYTLNLRAQHADPLKLYEYAAASKPIVATDFPAARDFEGHVEIAHDKDEFLAACERCLAAGATSPSIEGNRRIAANNTWQQRVERISEIIRSRDAAMPHG